MAEPKQYAGHHHSSSAGHSIRSPLNPKIIRSQKIATVTSPTEPPRRHDYSAHLADDDDDDDDDDDEEEDDEEEDDDDDDEVEEEAMDRAPPLARSHTQDIWRPNPTIAAANHQSCQSGTALNLHRPYLRLIRLHCRPLPLAKCHYYPQILCTRTRQQLHLPRHPPAPTSNSIPRPAPRPTEKGWQQREEPWPSFHIRHSIKTWQRPLGRPGAYVCSDEH
ncbi:hypothetical protein MCOR02_001982 [Pyricularia oryzae]|nr:hypothetical protein MCOR02_001982 [Pyricularia oryzae]